MRFCCSTLCAIILALSLTGPGEPQSKDADAEKGGQVNFTEILIQDKYGYAYGVAAADLDGDGNLDLVSPDTVNNRLHWFANDGKGNFKNFFVTKNEAGWLERLAIGDIDGDGKPDVVIVKNLASELIWFQNSGKPRESENWKKHLIATLVSRAYDVALADFDGDGRLDVATSTWNGNQFAWFLNPGKLDGKEWTRHMLDSNVKETRTIRAADFNGDGKPDLLGSARLGNLVVWYENPGKPLTEPWKKHVIDDQSPFPTHGQPVDMDGDGDLDVVMALGMLAPVGMKDTNMIVWYENVGKGTKWTKHVIGELDGAFEAVAADLNGDGFPDVVATAWGGKGQLVWFENPGDPKKTPWKKHILKDNWTRANQVIVADLNKDGRPDIIATAERGSNELRWWRNEGRRKP